ncbi:NUDIX hydrolase [Pontibacillus litoralis]|uniref:Nudix hydrolase domain-containing protein n=1 Tax=Pontibacillus litoralis JSM 072002 TaxID=1385512 RepID=A0A0A5G240_9BACI|nr:NUDIX hydrolase [Pontibacillus litoralis]KGX86089.1 hypothetical protein N784_05875 [Pontibacillus litoralis JSM 072002]
MKQGLRATWQHQLEQYMMHYPKEESQLGQLMKERAAEGDLFDRKRLPGHITGSGFILDEEHMLLIYHPFLKMWIQPGGHVEAGESPLEAAIREVKEETGIDVHLHPWHDRYPIPYDIDIHEIPANEKKGEPAHYHYDFRFLFQPQKNQAGNLCQTCDREDIQMEWLPLNEVKKTDLRFVVEKVKPIK